MRDPKKHRASVLKNYYAHREEILKRRKERRDLRRAAQGIMVEPHVASRMAVMRAAPRHVLQQPWTQNLFEKMAGLIAEKDGSRHTSKSLRIAVRLILAHAEKDGLAQERDITPPWLAGFPRLTKDLRKELIYRSNFGRLLLKLCLWSENDYQLFGNNLAALKRRGSPGRRVHGPKPAPSPPVELRRLVRELAYRCGLSTGEMRELRVTCIEADGLRIPRKTTSEAPAGLIPFGDGWDQLPKAIPDAYIRKEKPTDYLFFSRSPRDKSRPLSKMTLNGAVVTLQTTIERLRNQHFDKDLNRARSLQAARFHLRNVHHLSNQHVHNMIAGSRWHKGYANEAVAIPIPAPYLLAAMCASRSVSEENAKTTIPESGGGKRHLMTWDDLLGYGITVDWPRRFAAELAGRGQKSVRALRLLYRLAFDFWFEGRRMKLPDIDDSAIRQEDKDLLEQLGATRVVVRDLASSQASWVGSMFEYGTRKRSFRIPLIEDMNRRAWHNQCQVCWHPERRSIEREISEAATKETRKKGYHLIAGKYGVSYPSLKAHSGRRVPRSGRGETQRSHFSTGSITPIVRCPRKLFGQLPKWAETELMIYSLVLLEINRAGTPGLIVSTQLIEQGLHLRLSESQLSVALNHLTGAGVISFRRDPKGFYVELLQSLVKSTSLAA